MSTKPRQFTHCLVCGKPLTGHRSRYCSPECSDRIHKSNVGMVRTPAERGLAWANTQADKPPRRTRTGSFGETPMPPKAKITAMLVQINIDHPLQGGAAQPTDGKQPYSVRATGLTLADARRAADDLIERRTGKRPPKHGYINAERYVVDIEEAS